MDPDCEEPRVWLAHIPLALHQPDQNTAMCSGDDADHAVQEPSVGEW
jgi:hypothetical protein